MGAPRRARKYKSPARRRLNSRVKRLKNKTAENMTKPIKQSSLADADDIKSELLESDGRELDETYDEPDEDDIIS